MKKMLKIFSANILVLLLSLHPCLANEEMGIVVENAVDTNLNLAARFTAIIIFLILLWGGSNLLITGIKMGRIKLPAFITKGNPLFAAHENSKYSIEILDRKVIHEGAELLIVDISGRHLLLSKTTPGSINYITELKESNQE